MDDIKLLGMQRAEFQRAETMSNRSNIAQGGIVLMTILSVFVKIAELSYVLALINLCLAGLWLFFSFQGKKSHRTAEKARRAVVFSNGLGIKMGRKSYTDLLMQFKVLSSEGEKFEDQTYFKATGTPGNKKIAEIIEESSFWSKHLCKISAVHHWVYFGTTFIVSIAGILLIPLINVNGLNIQISQVFCLVLIGLITGNLFSTAMSYTSAGSSADSVESQLSVMVENGNIDQDVLVVIADYNALVESSPIIPSKIYEKNKNRLNDLWKRRKE